MPNRGMVEMEVTKNTVITKFKDELQHLERKKENVPAEERRFVEDIMGELRRDLVKIQAARKIGDFLDENEKMNTQARMIDVLNELDLQLRDLETTITMHSSLEIAAESVEQFFITCQIAENVIKFSGLKGYSSKDQISALNRELKEKVDRMILLSTQSTILAQALQHSRRAQVVLAV